MSRDKMAARLDEPIGPQNLRDEIIEVLQVCGGAVLRSALEQRCRLATDSTHFSSTFGELVLLGDVVAAGGSGQRVLYRLADRLAKSPVATPPSGPSAADRRGRIVQLLTANGPMTKPQLARSEGVGFKNLTYVLSMLAREKVIEHAQAHGESEPVWQLRGQPLKPTAAPAQPAAAPPPLLAASPRTAFALWSDGAITVRQGRHELTLPPDDAQKLFTLMEPFYA